MTDSLLSLHLIQNHLWLFKLLELIIHASRASRWTDHNKLASCEAFSVCLLAVGCSKCCSSHFAVLVSHAFHFSPSQASLLETGGASPEINPSMQHESCSVMIMCKRIDWYFYEQEIAVIIEALQFDPWSLSNSWTLARNTFLWAGDLPLDVLRVHYHLKHMLPPLCPWAKHLPGAKLSHFGWVWNYSSVHYNYNFRNFSFFWLYWIKDKQQVIITNRAKMASQ